MDLTINPLPYPALAELKNAVAALDPSSSYADMFAQFQLVEVALTRAKLERAATENRLIGIASLPHEILSHIFGVHRDLHCNSGHRQWVDCMAPSIRVSHVSATWRNAALSTASLWAAFISLPIYTDEFYRTMIHRSREAPLEFTIRVGDPHDLPSANLLARFIPSQVHRLRQLCIKAPLHFIDDRSVALQVLSAPRMTLLYLENTTREGNPPPPLRRIFTHGAPMLSHFEVLGFDPRIRPPLTSVKTLAINCVAITSHTHLALREAAVTTLCLVVKIAHGVLTSPTIQMPSLKNLYIIAPYFEIAILLEMLEAPILKDLSLHSHTPGRLMPQLHVHGTAAGKFPKLQSLRLQGALGSGILTAFPTIHRLFIHDSPFQPVQLGDIFDPNQDAFSTLTPHLTLIQAPERLKKSIWAFIAARRSLGLCVPRFIVASGM